MARSNAQGLQYFDIRMGVDWGHYYKMVLPQLLTGRIGVRCVAWKAF